jgi:hypothetical protein
MQHSRQDLEATVYLTLGKIAPDYEGGELNIGGSTVSSAITEVTGVLFAFVVTRPQSCAQRRTNSVLFRSRYSIN